MDPMEIFQDLREKIIWLELKPGETLNLVELAETYGVSRNPVTIALTRLDVEKWVVKSGSHYVVSPLTIDGIRETAEIRAVLEVQAHLWAMHRLTPKGLQQLQEMAARIASLDDSVSNREMVELDVRFHQIVYRETQNQVLADFLERMLSHYLRFWLSNPNPIQKDKFFDEALTIVKAMENKDEVALRAAATAHIKASLDEIAGLPVL